MVYDVAFIIKFIMVLRRIPGSNIGTKISTFGLVMMAGCKELLKMNKQFIIH